LTGRKSDITHYCILETPPFDYVEPKVWTVEEVGTAAHLKAMKNGRCEFTVYSSSRAYRQFIEDALNEKEERNATT
jgi:hypothetical protein